MKLLTTSLAGALIAYVAYTWGALIHRTLTVLGVLRWDVASTHTNQADSIVTIPDTTHCEDIHHHAPSNLLFTACEDDPNTRFVWFPPLGTLDDPELAARSRGSIHVIDPTVSLHCPCLGINSDTNTNYTTDDGIPPSRFSEF